VVLPKCPSSIVSAELGLAQNPRVSASQDCDGLLLTPREREMSEVRRLNGFEVDLTIADEDFEKQFWFIDFRFLFTPAPAEPTDALRAFVEFKVNEALAKEGLQGCYNFLHEFVLTHKVTEFVRQAVEMTRGNWVDTLKVERLNRAMSIQYWSSRSPPDLPKSWIILGIHSGKTPGATTIDPKSTSHLTLRWFRDNKEVKDAVIDIDDQDISTETLLKTVIARHVEYILSTMHTKLRSTGRFARREAALSLSISKNEPVRSALKMQLGHNDFVTIRMVPTTGSFSITPQTAPVSTAEMNLNWKIKDPMVEGLNVLERMRCYYTADEMNRRGISMGWAAGKAPIKPEEVRSTLQIREPFQPIWFRRRDWPPEWYLMLSLSLSGDKWWLFEV
jgi:mediator of RNA polymerase II transcription subunit 14